MTAPYDSVIETIADYTAYIQIDSPEAYSTARLCLVDTIACGFLALKDNACKKLMGPFFPHTTTALGARVPGTSYMLDPMQAAFNIGVMNRWLDYNDTWLAAEWGHPSDNIAAILAVADYVSNTHPLTMKQVFTAIIKSYEIQGVLALSNSLNAVGFDHVHFVKIASTAVATQLLGGDAEDIRRAVSHAWVDGIALRTYRHAPNTVPRKSWAAGDAASRAVFLSQLVLRGEIGLPTALTAPKWGFNDVVMQKKEISLERPLLSYVMENILFKVSYPAEFHAQTAVEAAMKIHPLIKDHLDKIESVEIDTHASAIKIISKTGPLHNFADRDHCLQYMVAVALLYGDLKATDYSNVFAEAHPEIDQLRAKMTVKENMEYSIDYLDPDKRSIASSVTVKLHDGIESQTEEVCYPLGHRRRREEAVALLRAKAEGAGLKHAYSHLHDDTLFQDWYRTVCVGSGG